MENKALFMITTEEQPWNRPASPSVRLLKRKVEVGDPSANSSSSSKEDMVLDENRVRTCKFEFLEADIGECNDDHDHDDDDGDDNDDNDSDGGDDFRSFL